METLCRLSYRGSADQPINEGGCHPCRIAASLVKPITHCAMMRVAGEGFEPPKLTRLIYSQIPLAAQETRLTMLGFPDIAR